jgi:hypothetical protein
MAFTALLACVVKHSEFLPKEHLPRLERLYMSIIGGCYWDRREMEWTVEDAPCIGPDEVERVHEAIAALRDEVDRADQWWVVDDDLHADLRYRSELLDMMEDFALPEDE